MSRQTFLFIFAVLSIMIQTVFSQENPGGPLADFTYLRKPQDIATFALEYKSYHSYSAHQIWDFQYFPGIGDSIMTGPKFTHLDSLPATGDDFHDIITGNFTGDSRDEVATVWETGNRAVALAVSGINPLTDEWTDLSLHSTDSLALMDMPIPEGTSEDSIWFYSGIECRLLRIEKGNFDNDEKDELVLAYWAADSTVRIEMYDDATGFSTPRASVSSQRLSAFRPKGPGDGYFNIFYFDIAVADFNNDGNSEILLFGKDIDTEPSAKLFAALYAYNPGAATFTLKARADVANGLTLSANDRIRYIFSTAGRMNAAGKGDGIISVSVCDPGHHPYLYALQTYDVSDDLSAITFGAPMNYGYINTIKSIDANNDGYDETFILTRDSLFICNIDSTRMLRRTFAARGTPFGGSDPLHTYFYCYSRHALAVFDMDTDTSAADWMPELMVGEISWPPMENPEYRTCFYNFLYDSTRTITGLQLRKAKEGYSPQMFVPGNFDGGDIRLGMPARYRKTDILQPIVILNAPPIHFDVFDGTAWDISNSYPNTCLFYARYEKQTENSVEVQTRVSQSWGVSQSFGFDLSYMGIGARASMEQRYGKNFSRVSGSSRTITVGEQIDAILEDEIFATVVDYDMWEYPAYNGDQLIGHILVMDPVQVSNRRFSSKGWSANGYIPNHEIGNILSYQRYPTLASNEDVAELISGTYDRSYELGPSPLADWSLEYQDFANSQAETVNNIGIDLNTGGSFFGFSWGGSETYNREEISTHQTTVTRNLKISVHFDAVAMNLGEVRYIVTPYSYWAKNGALVVDYAVQPDLAPPGYTPTWWQVHYEGVPDPAFILPWRLDPEKGFYLQDEAKRYQTNEILFSSLNPQAGDTVGIRARVHNYSLSPTLTPVKVRFYVGDPDSGGTPITGIHGETDVSTAAFIGSRENAVVEMQWVVPPGLPLYPRIYARLDPDNEMDEIHEENNKGFTVLGRQNEIVGFEQENADAVPGRYALEQNYPNPFNPVTTIAFSVPTASKVTLKIFDILGREVAVLMDNELVSAGHAVKRWNAGSLSSGIYFYQLRARPQNAGGADSFTKTKKLILMK